MLIAGVRAVGGVETQAVKPASVRPAANAGSSVDVSDRVTLTSSSRLRERQTAARLRELAVTPHANPQVARQLAHDYTYSNPEQLVGLDVRDAVVRMGTGNGAARAQEVAQLKARAQAEVAAEAAEAAEVQAQQAQPVQAKEAVSPQPVEEAHDAEAIDTLKGSGGADMDKIIAMVDSQLSDMRGALGAGTAAAAASTGDAPALTTSVSQPQPAPSAPQPAPAASAA